MKKYRERFNIKGIGIVTALFISVGAFILINYVIPDNLTENQERPVDHENGSVEIPAIQLPKDSLNADMVGLFVYNGKIYTQTNTKINDTDAKALKDEKLGTTKGNIDEWSKQKDDDEELASTIGEMDVYSVKGYDKDFRLMVYQRQDGNHYAEFFENLNGLTISSGKDVFGKLNLVGNVTSAHWSAFSDWDNDIDNYKPIFDMDALNTFLIELNKTKPLPREQNSDPINSSRNNEEYRELALKLNDGSTVNLTLLRDGYIYYGITDVYFEMNEGVFSMFWDQLK
ncbi:hypothetical protein [Sporosarcina sp. P29]|uniref:hypothetical protein n=1 Tax=Sporosarcina sp. P29 TaxID=2048252 RepID=UPI000C16FC2B|nr:hypothetical protein [Sporosarcina sp. P29]PIC98032.1 hypothetical protein CSV68_15285 [Sporosarcina sp. P29]